MARHFPQPSELRISEPLEKINTDCGRCGEAKVYRYRVVDYRGWLRVTKCRHCLLVTSREPIPPPWLAEDEASE